MGTVVSHGRGGALRRLRRGSRGWKPDTSGGWNSTRPSRLTPRSRRGTAGPHLGLISTVPTADRRQPLRTVTASCLAGSPEVRFTASSTCDPA